MADERDENEKPNYDGYEHLVALAINGLKSEKAAEWAAAHMNVTKVRIDAELSKGRADAFFLVAKGLQKAFDIEAKYHAQMSKHNAKVAQLHEHPAFREMNRNRRNATPN
jgi:hypothetical protein